MSLNRYNAKRDENEPEIVDALQKAGFFVTRLSDWGVPDLLVLKPAENVPVITTSTPENALEIAQLICEDGFLLLLEVKAPGKKLNKAQRQWFHTATMGAYIE